MAATGIRSAEAVARLVTVTLAGDLAAFERLVRLHEGLVYSEAVRGCPEQARDIAQESFIRAYRRLATLRDPRRFTPWLFSIVRHVVREHRRRRRLDVLPLESVPEGALPAVAPVFPQDMQPILSALEVLPLDLRLPLVLRYEEDLSYAQIAERLGLSEVAVRTRVHRARRALAARLAQKR